MKINVSEIKQIKRLTPKKWELLKYYAPTLFIMTLPIMNFYYLAKHSLNDDPEKLQRTIDGFNIVWVFLGLAIFSFVIKYFALRFKSIKANITDEKFKVVIDKTIKELNWKAIKRNKSLLIAESNSSLIGYGERVTIIKDNNVILINSICNPDAQMSIFSFGGNEKNIWTVKRNIKTSV